MKRALPLFFFIFLSCAAGCGQRAYKDAEFSMGTMVEVTSSDPKAKDIVFLEFRRLEKIFNLFDSDSELSVLNASGEMHVSEDLFRILMKSHEFFVETQGAFDVSIAPVSLLWKRAIQESKLPDIAQVKEALAHVGFDYVYLDAKNHLVKILKEGLKLDLGGIAKGYALDQAVLKLRKAGVKDALINAGGEIYGLGMNHQKPWHVGIQNPRNEKRIIKKIDLENLASATSGDYEQFFVFQDKRYSHIIDPKTGTPADAGIVSATVIAPDGATADALGTACVVLGAKRSSALIKKFKDTHAILVTREGKIIEI